MIHVLLKGIGNVIALGGAAVCVIADFDGAISGQEFRSRVGLEAQHGLLQQRVAHLRHALHGRTISRAVQARYLNLEAQQLDALGAVFDPLAAALKVIGHATDEIIGNVLEFDVIDLVNEVVKPALWRCLLVVGVFDWLAIQ